MAATTVKVIDYSVYPAREETVTLPGMPRTGELFVWDTGGQQRAIQGIIWCAEDSTMTIQVN